MTDKTTVEQFLYFSQNQKTIMTKFLQELLQQPQALTETAAYYESTKGIETIDSIAEALKTKRHIIATGMGSSYFLAQALALIAGQCGIAISAVNAGELLHYSLPSITADTLMIAISQSGESYETVNVIKQLEARGTKPMIATITNEKESTLARMSSITLPTLAGMEEKTSSKTFITAYQVIYLIASRLNSGLFPAISWSALAASVQEILDARNTITPVTNKALGNAPYIQLISRGATMAAASQCALMSMEASHTPSSALPGGEFRHGPLEMVQEGFTAIILSHSSSSTFEQTKRLINDITAFGGKVILVTDRADAISTADNITVLAAPAPAEELFAITSIIPVQLAIEAWAREVKNITPGEFLHGAKVTAIE